MGKGWNEVEFTDVAVSLHGPVAIAMGHYHVTRRLFHIACEFTQATGDNAGAVSKVEFTFGYKRDSEGAARIFLHHSSKPYEGILNLHRSTTSVDVSSNSSG